MEQKCVALISGGLVLRLALGFQVTALAQDFARSGAAPQHADADTP